MQFAKDSLKPRYEMGTEAAYFPNAVGRVEPSGIADSLQESSVHPVDLGTMDVSKRPHPNLISASDEVTMERMLAGDSDALAQLFRRYSRTVRRVAARILRDDAEADDLVQEVFLFVFRKADLFNPEKGTALTWILRVTYHRAFDRRRYLIARKFYLSQEIEPHLGRLEDPRQEVRFNAQSWEGVLGEKMADRFRSRLTPEQQETLQLFFFEGYALKEIAELTGRSLVNVRSHYYRGLERLRRYVLPQNKRLK